MANNRQRMVFECPERLKKAIRMRAALDGLRPSGVILAALSRHLDAELAVVDQRCAESSGPAKASSRELVK